MIRETYAFLQRCSQWVLTVMKSDFLKGTNNLNEVEIYCMWRIIPITPVFICLVSDLLILTPQNGKFSGYSPMQKSERECAAENTLNI